MIKILSTMNKSTSINTIKYVSKPDPKVISKILEGMKPALVVLSDS